MDLELLEELCAIPGISGDESKIKEFLLSYIEANCASWKSKPQVIAGKHLQDGFILKFGNPKVAVFAHMDTVGYTAAYGANLIRVGGPDGRNGDKLVGVDKLGPIECELLIEENDGRAKASYLFDRQIELGTPLSYKPNFRISGDYVSTPYLDNRLGVFVALQLAQEMEDGLICFSTYEETGGGNAQVLGKYIFENYQVSQALICDITWVTSGVQHGNGVAISTRDSGIPRYQYLEKIISIARKSGIPHQLEVESSGGSDGNVLQRSDFPFDWCFIGAAENNVHSSNETVHLSDILSMKNFYSQLLKEFHLE